MVNQQLAAEIHGAGFKNKGAELMLRAVVSELRRRIKGFQPAVDPLCGDYSQRSRLGLYQICPARGHAGGSAFKRRFYGQKVFSKLHSNRVTHKVIGRVMHAYGCVSLHQIDALIDISGFAFSDDWGPKPMQDFASLAAYYKKGKSPLLTRCKRICRERRF